MEPGSDFVPVIGSNPVKPLNHLITTLQQSYCSPVRVSHVCRQVSDSWTATMHYCNALGERCPPALTYIARQQWNRLSCYGTSRIYTAWINRFCESSTVMGGMQFLETLWISHTKHAVVAQALPPPTSLPKCKCDCRPDDCGRYQSRRPRSWLLFVYMY